MHVITVPFDHDTSFTSTFRAHDKELTCKFLSRREGVSVVRGVSGAYARLDGRLPATDSIMFTLNDALLYVQYVAMALGIPGNILSATVWLRRRVVSKNSSAVYLAALAIDDLVYLLCGMIDKIFIRVVGSCFHSSFCYSVWYIGGYAAGNLEPLLVLGFSVERLIAILRPLQVSLCCIRFTLKHCNVS